MVYLANEMFACFLALSIVLVIAAGFGVAWLITWAFDKAKERNAETKRQQKIRDDHIFEEVDRFHVHG